MYIIMNIDRNIDSLILKLLKEYENPVSTREVALRIGKAWNTVNTHCLQLQIVGKIEGLKISNLNLWRIKNENKK